MTEYNEPFNETSTDPFTQPAKKLNWFARNWLWFIPLLGLGSLAICASFVGMIVFVVFTSMKSSGAYQEAISLTQENPAAIEALGSPIEPGWWVSGSINVSGPSGDADLAIPVSGPNGAGTLYVEAKKSAGEWAFRTLQLAPDDAGGRIDILGGR